MHGSGPKPLNPEAQRLKDNVHGHKWRLWGPYLAERQWGTVREDYSAHGNAWEYFSHDHARSRAYRWGEDGIAGVSDDEQQVCLALAVWNGRDPILKERLYGLTNGEGNHGEDVKELYYYLDATPTHSYLKMLYKYPQAAFPYERLIAENRSRGIHAAEFELVDTGVFDDDRYFDVEIEYAKATVDDLLMRVTVHNRGPDPAPIHALPTLWFRNTWSWSKDAPKPSLAAKGGAIAVQHPRFGEQHLYGDGRPGHLFTENETNPKLFGFPTEGYFKDAFHDYVVDGRRAAVNPAHTGTKVALHYSATVPARGSVTFRVRLAPKAVRTPFTDFDTILAARKTEADAFYADLQTDIPDADERHVQRQAFAGIIWSKQFYYFNVRQWLNGDPTQPPPPASRRRGRNREWAHLHNAEIISMPDNWEYPWYAAWDLAFHCIPIALIDADFAKYQLRLLGRANYMHPNGQLPAYEWAFSDVNPPVHAWAAWRVFQIDRKQRGDKGDFVFLETVFHKLMINFTWWVNRKDPAGRNVFAGGFLGLDNIGVFDRSAPLPTGGYIEQADGTAWMAMYCLNLMRIAMELATYNPVYEEAANKFFGHFLHIAEAMADMGGTGTGLWDDDDKFYYDVLALPGGTSVPLRVRSLVGLIPLLAVETIDPDLLERLPHFKERIEWFLDAHPNLATLVSRWKEPGRGERRLLSLLRGHRMKRLLKRMLDETEFLSDYGVRSVSKAHQDKPFVLEHDGREFTVGYRPAESDTGVFGGNSNWRGPIWFPINYLLIEALQKFHHYYGDDFKVECPTGSGTMMTLHEVADELSHRLKNLFLKDSKGRRPVFGDHEKFQRDPHFRDHVLFYEYFHGDNGRGVGASHQTGWTALVAKLIQRRKPARW